MMRFTVLDIPGGKIGLYVDGTNKMLIGLDIHTAAKLRIRLERQTDDRFLIHVYRRNRCILTREAFIKPEGQVEVKNIFADPVALNRYNYGARRQRRSAHAHVRMPSDPAGEAKAQAAAVQP